MFLNNFGYKPCIKGSLRTLRSMQIKVECYSGYRGEETPRYFWLDQKRIKVENILAQWLEPDGRYFKVSDRHKTQYVLRCLHSTSEWELIDGSAEN